MANIKRTQVRRRGIKNLLFARFASSEKIGEQTCLFKTFSSFPNHQLFNKTIEWKLKIPYVILREYNEKISEAEAAFGGRSGALQSIKKDQSFVWSNLLNEVRTFFEQNSEQ